MSDQVPERSDVVAKGSQCAGLTRELETGKMPVLRRRPDRNFLRIAFLDLIWQALD
jgi:hypothetical protein